jgi:hypothetical protein
MGTAVNRLENPFIIDVEASGFGSTSYPIEVGVALDDGKKYCTLILPSTGWTHWDKDAEKVHGISRDLLLTYGTPVDEVADTLNDLLDGVTLFTDGWVVDKPWLTTLFHAAGRPMCFDISPLEIILSEEQMAHWHVTKDRIIDEMNLARHRASYDAWIIQETYRQTLGMEHA